MLILIRYADLFILYNNVEVNIKLQAHVSMSNMYCPFEQAFATTKRMYAILYTYDVLVGLLNDLENKTTHVSKTKKQCMYTCIHTRHAGIPWARSMKN